MLNRLIRLAAFQNPDFYKAQAMRLSTSANPGSSVVRKISRPMWASPGVCLDDALELIKTHNIKPELADQIKAVPDSKERVILSTGRYIGEGFD